jgi:hypothetical protein
MEEPALSAVRPLSIKELADAAEDYKWNTGIALKYWIRAATALLSEVRSCQVDVAPIHVFC